MLWNQDIFVKNVLILVDKYCGGNQSVFNDEINSRDAVTKWRPKDGKAGNRPALDVLLRIPEKFYCSLDWLLTDDPWVFSHEARLKYPGMMHVVADVNKAAQTKDTSRLILLLKGLIKEIEDEGRDEKEGESREKIKREKTTNG